MASFRHSSLLVIDFEWTHIDSALPYSDCVEGSSVLEAQLQYPKSTLLFYYVYALAIKAVSILVIIKKGHHK